MDAFSHFSLITFENAISELKTGKSPGLDGIYSEYLKSGGEPLVKALLHLFSQILKTGNIPNQFKEALIVVIYKEQYVRMLLTNQPSKPHIQGFH